MGAALRRDVDVVEEASEPEFLTVPIGATKYAVVLSGGYEDYVLGWDYDADSALRIAQAPEPSRLTEDVELVFGLPLSPEEGRMSVFALRT
jgi:hypothetical protein